jgi:uncharacterized protein YecE (DUF72 family)
MNLAHIGTIGWSYEHWIGNFYPQTTRKKDLLPEYSKHFSTVEVDSTFYRIPNLTTIKKWKEQTPKDFIFSIKFPKAITHDMMLKNSLDKTNFFIKRISSLNSKLGPLLMQFPYMFKPNQTNLLKDFLHGLPKRKRFVVEVRNRKWLEKGFYSLLRDNGIALALVDHPWMPEIEEITTNFTYIRWEGDRKHINGTLGRIERDRTDDTMKWARKIKNYVDESREVYGYYGKFYSGHSPTDAKKLLNLLSGKKKIKTDTLDRFLKSM